jgi:branched-chain amino acid transport system substrate-binding protein
MIKDSNTCRNPYIIGRPIESQELLFGREKIFQFIQDNLEQNIKVLFLYGQRRIGLSSVISHIPKYINEEFVCVTFDIQEHSQESYKSLLYILIQNIISNLNIDIDTINLPSFSELEKEPELLGNIFLTQVNQYLKNKKILLIIKEFSVKQKFNLELQKFCVFLYSILQEEGQTFSIILVCRGTIKNQFDLIKLFNNAPAQEVGLLDEQSAEQLIIKPAQGILEFEKDAVTAIQELSAGHPYFTQVICFTIFVQARIENNWRVTRVDVEAIIDKAIESAEAGLAWIWDEISIPERIVLSAVAEAQKIALEKKLAVPKEPLKLLKEYGIAETDELIQSLTELVDKKLLDDTKRKVKIELVRRWLVQRHPLEKQILELGILKQKQDDYPNEEPIKAEHQAESSEVKLIRILKNQKKALSLNANYLQHKLQLLILPILLFGTGTLFGILLSISFNIFSSCPVGQRKENLFYCVTETTKPISIISRGERTLFPTNTNSDRNLGIAAFNQDNYEQAADYFSQAVQKEPNDPEVLIYYNNALARTKQKFVTFAVAVPVTTNQDYAQAMLRGVAQAQNEFNVNGGYNGQLLEIVIANDANDEKEAKKVAQELVKDKSVLAIIGHSTSGTTKAALYEYQTEQPPLAVISPASANSQLKEDFFFRTTPSNSKDGQVLAEYIHQQGLKKVVVFYNQDGFFSNDMRERFEREFERLGGQVFESTDLAASNFNADQALTESVSKYQAQAIVLFPEATHIPAALEIMKARANSSNSQVQKLMLFGSSSLYSQQTLTDGSKAVEGLIIAVPWFREASQSRKFAQKAEKQWRGEVDWSTATSYDATKALINALSSNPSRTTVLQKLQQVNLPPQQTSGNPVKFEQGEIQTQPVLVKVEGGKFQLLP